MGDFLSIFDGRDLQSHEIQKFDTHFNNNKRTISSSGKDMLVQFFTDALTRKRGFKASVHYMPIESNCANWLNKNTQLLESPDYPTNNCSWVITASSSSTNCTIHFETFEVKQI